MTFTMYFSKRVRYKKNYVLYLALLEYRLNPAAMFVAQLDENIEEDGYAM